MGKCTKMNCPMQYDAVDENCDIKDCPFRTDSDVITKLFLEGAAKYLENTMEITKKVRVPKGDTCDGCLFKKHESPLYSDSYGCAVGGGVWCALYGEQLKLKGGLDIRANPALAIVSPNGWTYNKCNECLEDTKAKD